MTIPIEDTILKENIQFIKHFIGMKYEQKKGSKIAILYQLLSCFILHNFFFSSLQ